jgi:hypothetical protein
MSALIEFIQINAIPWVIPITLVFLMMRVKFVKYAGPRRNFEAHFGTAEKLTKTFGADEPPV